jgi:hypothetical protein
VITVTRAWNAANAQAWCAIATNAETATKFGVKNKRTKMPTVLNDWVNDLTYMQQSVLLCAIRNHDGFNKHNPAKEITRYLRRVLLKSAFDGRMLVDPHEPGGGNFTGPLRGMSLYDAVTAFLDGRDEMTLHYWLHMVHAFEIVGYLCPIPHIRINFLSAYQRCISAMHVMPESQFDMERRLSDNEEKWLERSDAYEREAHQREKAAKPHLVGTSKKDGVFTETYSDGSELSGPIGEMGCACHGAVGVKIDRPSDGEIYAAASQQGSSEFSFGRDESADFALQDAEDTLRRLATAEPMDAELARLAPGQGDQGYPEPNTAPRPTFAATRDDHFVNIQTGLLLGHEFDLKWSHRFDEFPVYVEPEPVQPSPVKRTRDNLGASDYDG